MTRDVRRESVWWKEIQHRAYDQLTSRMSRVVAFIALCFIVRAASAPNASTTPANAENQRCVVLSQLNLESAPGGPGMITSARLVDTPATGLEEWAVHQSGYGSSAVLRTSAIRQYCDVTGYIAPQNKFELKLPLAAEWNQKFFFHACGGFCGRVDRDALNLSLARGYASVTGNGGHDSALGFDGIWAANAPELQEDFGWRSNHIITVITKTIVTHYYGKPITHAYMAGNSKGGQAVLLEAQKFPEDFDGLMPSAPVYDYTGRSVIAASWFAQAVTDGHGGSVLNDDAGRAVHKSVLQHCGAQAGVEEGLVTDPSSCKWQPEMVACADANRGPDCLSPSQVAAVKRLMVPITNSKKDVLYNYPYIPGTETQWAGWNYWGAPSPAYPPRFANLELPVQYLRYLADEKVRDHVDSLKFDFDRDPATLARARQIYDASSLDLRAFKAHGGKMLMWHGWADGAIMATSSIGYYEGVMKFMGGRKQTEDFFRLFLVPGVHHGGGGPGLTDFDALTALEDWVEKGQAPDKLIACRAANGVVERCRPVFPYPVLAHYSGKGDPTQPGSFVPFDIHKQYIETNQQNIATNKQQIETNIKDIEENTQRFMALSEYDVKGQATVNFEVGSSKISAKNQIELKELANTATRLKGYIIEVMGYTDSTGNAAMNTKLSEDRAKAVITYLVQQGAVPVKHIVAPGAMGEYGAAAPNETKAGRAENRRVEVKVLVNKGIAGSYAHSSQQWAGGPETR